MWTMSLLAVNNTTMEVLPSWEADVIRRTARTCSGDCPDSDDMLHDLAGAFEAMTASRFVSLPTLITDFLSAVNLYGLMVGTFYMSATQPLVKAAEIFSLGRLPFQTSDGCLLPVTKRKPIGRAHRWAVTASPVRVRRHINYTFIIQPGQEPGARMTRLAQYEREATHNKTTGIDLTRTTVSNCEVITAMPELIKLIKTKNTIEPHTATEYPGHFEWDIPMLDWSLEVDNEFPLSPDEDAGGHLDNNNKRRLQLPRLYGRVIGQEIERSYGERE